MKILKGLLFLAIISAGITSQAASVANCVGSYDGKSISGTIDLNDDSAGSAVLGGVNISLQVGGVCTLSCQSIKTTVVAVDGNKLSARAVYTFSKELEKLNFPFVEGTIGGKDFSLRCFEQSK